MRHCLYCKHLHIHLHFSTTVGTIGTSPKIYKKLLVFIMNVPKIINTVHKITL